MMNSEVCIGDGEEYSLVVQRMQVNREGWLVGAPMNNYTVICPSFAAFRLCNGSLSH
jgi:hypothetical protein